MRLKLPLKSNDFKREVSIRGKTAKPFQALFFLSVFIVNTCWAETTITDPNSIFHLSLEELANIKVSIATGTENTVKTAPAVASVITAEDVRKLGARTLNDVLETVPGLHVSLSGVNRLDTIYSIRGIHTGFNPHVLLLLDGNPIQWTLLGGRPFLYRLPANIISRVEIIRGPGSAIYGSDAFSGVINVITKDTDDVDKIELAARAGSFFVRDIWLNYATHVNEWALSANITYMQTDGDQGRTINSDLQSLLDFQLGTAASHAPGPLSTDYKVLDLHLKASSPKWNLNFWKWSSTNTGNGPGGAQALDPFTKEDFHSHFIDVSYKHAPSNSSWVNILKATYFNHIANADLKLFPDQAVIPIGADGNANFDTPVGLTEFTEGMIGQPKGTTEEAFSEWIGSRRFKNHSLRLSLGYKDQRLNSSEKKNFGPGILDGTQDTVDGTLTDVSDTEYVFIPNTKRTIAHISVQDEWALNDSVNLTGGVRYDKYSDFGSTTNPRVAVVWLVNNSLTTKAMYGSAFRAPSFGELLYQNNPSTIGNPDLSPETIDTYELAATYSPTATIQANANLFFYDAQNMIEFVPSPIGSVAQNSGSQRGKGLELELRWLPSNQFSFTINGAFHDAYEVDTDNSVADAPSKQANLIVDWKLVDNWSVNLHGNWIAGRKRPLNDPRNSINDYSMINLNFIRKNLITGLDFSIKVKNAMDNDAREPSAPVIPDDFPLEGRGIWAQFTYSSE